MKIIEEVEIAGFRFSMEPIHDVPLTFEEHVRFNEACERWKQSVLLAMRPSLERVGPRLVTQGGELVDLDAANVQATLEASSATGNMPTRE